MKPPDKLAVAREAIRLRRLVSQQTKATSSAAHASIDKDKNRLRAMITDSIRCRGAKGATCDELEALLGLSHQTCSPRVVELRERGVIKSADLKRKTRGGRFAIVWILS